MRIRGSWGRLREERTCKLWIGVGKCGQKIEGACRTGVLGDCYTKQSNAYSLVLDTQSTIFHGRIKMGSDDDPIAAGPS